MVITEISAAPLLNNTSGSSIALPAQTHTAGNLLVAAFAHQSSGNHLTGVTNTAGDTWSKTTSTPLQQDGYIRTLELWYTLATAGHASDIVTGTLSNTSDTYNTGCVYEFNVTGGTWTFGSDGTATSGNITLTASNPSVIVFVDAQNSRGTPGITGFTATGIDGGDAQGYYWAGYDIVYSGLTVTPTNGNTIDLLAAVFSGTASGSTHGLFVQTPMNGLGVGGPFFPTQLG